MDILLAHATPNREINCNGKEQDRNQALQHWAGDEADAECPQNGAEPGRNGDGPCGAPINEALSCESCRGGEGCCRALELVRRDRADRIEPGQEQGRDGQQPTPAGDGVEAARDSSNGEQNCDATQV
jgi:hypothetical protein